MRTRDTQTSIAFTSPSSPGTVVHTSRFQGSHLTRADGLTIDASFLGASGGSLDIYLQRLVGGAWRDLVHFPTLTAGQAITWHTLTITGSGNSSITEVGEGLTPALVSGAWLNVMPGGDLRILMVAGAGTSAGAEQRISITSYTERN